MSVVDAPATPAGFAAALERPRRAQVLRQDGHFVWDGSLVRDDAGRYHLYASRWPAEHGYRGWLTHSRIIRAESDALEGPYTIREQLDVLNEPAWSRDMAHNPRVHRFGDRYYLYYIGTRWEGCDPKKAQSQANDEEFDHHWTPIRFRQRIAIATAPTAAGPWTPYEGNPILHPRPDGWDRGMTTNPALLPLRDGRYLMIYKSTSGPRAPLQLGAAIAPAPEGPFERIGPAPLLPDDIEDPCFWWQGDRYWMVAKDMTGKVCGIQHAGLLYDSPDGLHWHRTGSAPAYDLNLPWRDGPAESARFVERPFVYLEEGTPRALLNAVLVDPGPSGVLVRRFVRDPLAGLP